MSWRPDTSPLSGDVIRAWRKSLERTDEEYWQTPDGVSYPTQPQVARRMGITEERLRRAELDGAVGCFAALLRIHMDTGEVISPITTQLYYWEALGNHCGSYDAALAFIGYSQSGRTYTKWEKQGVVVSRFGAGRLMRICWDRLNLADVEPRRVVGHKLNRRVILKIKQMMLDGVHHERIVRECGVSKSTVYKYGKRPPKATE